MEKQPCVYILGSGRRGALYTGGTSDLMGRLHRHRTGVTTGWAARKHALRLVWYEQHGDMERAIVREKQIKKWYRDWKLNLIEATNPQWLDLGIGLGFEPVTIVTHIDPRVVGHDGVSK